MAETPNIGLFVVNLAEAANQGMTVFEFLEYLAGYGVNSNMEKIDESINVIKTKLSNYTSESVLITDNSKEGIELNQYQYNWTKKNHIEYLGKMLGNYEKGVLNGINFDITPTKSIVQFDVEQSFSKLANIETTGITTLNFNKGLVCERLMIDIQNNNQSDENVTVYITVDGVQETYNFIAPKQMEVQKSFYNSINRNLNDGSTIKVEVKTEANTVLVNSFKLQYDHINIDAIANFGDNFTQIIDAVYNELTNSINDNTTSITNVFDRTTTLENRATALENRTTVLENNLYNPNLLINSNFKVSELVNQRGENSYTNSEYCIDMWSLSRNLTSGSIDLTEKNMRWLFSERGTTGYFNFVQKFENFKMFENKTVTLSIKLRNLTNEGYFRNSIVQDNVNNYNAWYVKQSDGWQVLTRTFTFNDVINENVFVNLYLNDNYNDWEIEYAKLELGDVATAFVDDDMSTKLAKCRRYLQVFKGTNIFLGAIRTLTLTSTALINITLQNSMRINIPTLSFENVNMTLAKYSGNIIKNVVNIRTVSISKAMNGIVTLYIDVDDATGFDLDDLVRLQFLNTNDKLILSAEL